MHEDGLHYWTEPLPGERAQLWADLVMEGRLESTWQVGSPAGRAIVEAAAEASNRHALATHRKVQEDA